MRTSAPIKPFRAFVTNKYYENRDEYDSVRLEQPHTFEQYVKTNLYMLKKMYRKEVDKPSD